ncbi:MAG TPA: hypothetical protein VKZ44_02785, partial [Taishania sp.]|nr:hypothetical protein [Taishania sp.]
KVDQQQPKVDQQQPKVDQQQPKVEQQQTVSHNDVNINETNNEIDDVVQYGLFQCKDAQQDICVEKEVLIAKELATQSTLPCFTKPPQQIEDHYPFDSKLEQVFTLNFILSHKSEKDFECDIKFIQENFSDSKNSSSFKSSVNQLKSKLKQIPIQKPISTENGNSKYSLLESLIWIFGSARNCKHMKFHSSPPKSESQPISHFCETKLYHSITKQCSKGELPVCLLLYYDDFRKFRSTFGSTGGLYFTLASKYAC